MEDCEKTHKTERRKRDADDRKTVKSVLDKKTLEIIDKLLKQGMIIEMYGEVCVGKEACVYLATASSKIYSKMCRRTEDAAEEPIKVAIKIYKTSTMMFKDRERYITGERRFKRYAKGNSRKLVKLWAEKEVRNLNRLQKAGIPSPKPLFLRRNILIMTMIGDQEYEKDKKDQGEIGVSGSASDDIYGSDEDIYTEESTGTEETESMSYTSTEEDISEETPEEDSSENSLANVTISTTDESAEESALGRKDSRVSEAEEMPVSEICLGNPENYLVATETESAGEEPSTSTEEECGLGGIAPNMKHAYIREEDIQKVYEQVVSLIKRMYRECGLVHADLSEYNLLYWKGVVYVIDVSQSVEIDHTNARRFLEMDVSNINKYFLKRGAAVRGDGELVDEVVSQEVVHRKEEKDQQETEVHEEETREERKQKKKEAKEKRRKERETKISKKEKKALSRKVRVLKKRNKFN